MTAGELLQRMASSRRQLLESITGLTEEQARIRPGEGEWSISEVLGHLMTSEEYLQSVASRMLAHADPAQEPLPSARAAVARDAPLPELVHGLQAARRRTELLLRSVKPDQLELAGEVPGPGRVTVAQVLGHIVEHEAEHAAAIAQARASFTGEAVTAPVIPRYGR